MRVYLKVKILSLAAEAQIIRKEARKTKGHVRYCLNAHRKNDVRGEARSALLAYGFLRGRQYSQMESKTHKGPDWKRVEALVRKYGEGDIRERMQRFSEWKDAVAQTA